MGLNETLVLEELLRNRYIGSAVFLHWDL